MGLEISSRYFCALKTLSIKHTCVPLWSHNGDVHAACLRPVQWKLGFIHEENTCPGVSSQTVLMEWTFQRNNQTGKRRRMRMCVWKCVSRRYPFQLKKTTSNISKIPWSAVAATSRAATGKVSRSHERERQLLIFPLFAALHTGVWVDPRGCGVFKLRMKVIQAVGRQVSGPHSTADAQSDIDCSILWQFGLLLCRKCHFHIFHCKRSVKSLLAFERDNTKLPFGDGKLTSAFICLTSDGILSLTLKEGMKQMFQRSRKYQWKWVTDVELRWPE